MRNRKFLALAAVALFASVSVASAQLTPIEQLGKSIFFDRIASPDNMSCATCHAPQSGWTGPIPGINAHGAVYRGAVPQRFGNRKPPSSGYATLAPNFQYDMVEGIFVGGNFWDGRATGGNLGNPAADQALGPFLNPVEQNNPSKAAVLAQIATAGYASLWETVWGEPLRYQTDAEIQLNYNRVGLGIAAYEGSSEVNQFSSKYDLYLEGKVMLTALEQWGMQLFNGKAMCNACHPAPLFTDFTFDNLGVPRNPENPFYNMDKVLLDDGSPINPLGAAWIDPGLGGFLQTLPQQYFTNLGLDKATTVAENMGKHKVPTLRNVDKRPGQLFPKAYMHNGALKSLKDVVHFYNTRDVADWPPPEVLENVNTDELGDLGLTDAEEDAIVAFMATLSDGFKVKSKGKVTFAQRADLRVDGPNPFNPTTHLTFALGEAGNVRVNVYDVRGHLVQTLVNGWKPEGQHVVNWYAGGLASGHYIVRLDTGDTIITRKLTLLK